MKIEPYNKAGGGRSGTLKNMTVETINGILGFQPNIDDDPDKVKHSWGFKVGRREFGIWDYKGSERQGIFSTSGDHYILAEIFGENYSKD